MPTYTAYKRINLGLANESRQVSMSLTLSCKLVEVSAVICAALLQNHAQDSTVL